MVKVYLTRAGKVEELELVNETPKGFRVKRSNYTTVELSVQWCKRYRQFEGDSEKFEIATLSKSEAEAHALQQRKDAVERVFKYQEHHLKSVGINPDRLNDVLHLTMDVQRFTSLEDFN
tara:strand:+ start:152 stop:508 length:357 start_codon:yes stop_codon:yes gene_type:complete